MKKITLAILACGILLTGCATMQDPVATNVASAIKKDQYLNKLTGITATNADGTVTLSGKVDNDFQKYQAGVVAKGVSGVKKVENKLKVE